MKTNEAITVNHISKVYKTGELETIALNDISFTISKGEYVAIMGPSGSGKSTLMHIIGALDTPTSGTYILDGENVEKLSDDPDGPIIATYSPLLIVNEISSKATVSIASVL